MENKIASAIFGIGILEIIVTFLIGFNYAKDSYEFMFGLFFMWVVGGFITGMLLIGLAQIIELLHHINVKMGDYPEQQLSSDESNVASVD